MFTIKHVEDSGHVGLWEAKLIWREPFQNGTNGNARPVFADIGEDHPLRFQSGTLYVMNGQGRTVSTYYFDPPQPQTTIADILVPPGPTIY